MGLKKVKTLDVSFPIGELTRTIRLIKFNWGIYACVDDELKDHRHMYQYRRFCICPTFPTIRDNVERSLKWFKANPTLIKETISKWNKTRN